jgi:hypothetical protein
MNILTKKNIKKLYELENIPFDILPKTRYIIFYLYYISYSNSKKRKYKFNIIEYNILEMKNIYLSYFEKTYNINSSLLSIIFLLRINYLVNYSMIQDIYIDLINEPIEKIINFILMDQKLIL